jgi:hypothetical protein
MPAIEPLCRLMGVNPDKLSKKESILLEAELFLRICEELKEIFRDQNKDYFRLLKLTKDKENTMLETRFMSFIIADILLTKDYKLEGIALYADTHEDVIQETYAGLNLYPSATLLRKLIELHRTVRRDLYQKIIKKIALEFLSVT